jgi:xanthine dehydrogenase large subunit
VTSPLHHSSPHESGLRHATGEALYVDDFPAPHGMLHAFPVPSPHAHARITRKDAAKARAIPGVHAVLFAEDVPGHLHVGPIVHDEELLAKDEVLHVGHPVAVVIAESRAIGRAAAAAIELGWEPLPAILTIDDAVAAGSFIGTPHRIRRGDADAALAASATRVAATVANGGQDHFYLETHAALVIPEEGGNYRVLSSTQHPTEVQGEVANVLGIGRHRVICEVPRMGGGFGGKESQASNIAAIAALGAWHTGRPVKLWLDREQDMTWTGKRHPFQTAYEAGFDADGRITALRVRMFANGGFSADLSTAILDRGLFHLDNAYFLPVVDFEGQVARTNLPSNTAFRGFGGPQGMLVVEDAIQRFAERTGRDPASVRKLNFYGDSPRDVTPYGQVVPKSRSTRIFDELTHSSDYGPRRAGIEAFNASHAWIKRGIAYQPVKFGISFTNALLNQAGALVLVYADGTVQLNHGGTEMGQGLHTKMLAVAAHELGVPVARIRVMTTATDKVPNTSATAASSGSDLNGAAVREACVTVRERMRAVAAAMLGVPGDILRFEGGRVGVPGGLDVAFADVARTAWVTQVSLSSTGYYRTPGIVYDRNAGKGTPFFYYAYGGAVVEVEVSGLTGEHRVLRADLLHDVGDPLIPSIDKGQVEGAFIQGLGWLTCEEVLFDAKGRCLTHGPSTYKIPAIGDTPADFRVKLLDRATQDGVIGGSKAVGEPPLMLAIGAVGALRYAISAFGARGKEVELKLPATPEAILRAVEEQRVTVAVAARPSAETRPNPAAK